MLVFTQPQSRSSSGFIFTQYFLGNSLFWLCCAERIFTLVFISAGQQMQTAKLQAMVVEAIKNFTHMPDDGLVRKPVVTALLGCSQATLWRMARDGRIAKPVRLSERVTAYRVGDVRKCLASLRREGES